MSDPILSDGAINLIDALRQAEAEGILDTHDECVVELRVPSAVYAALEADEEVTDHAEGVRLKIVRGHAWAVHAGLTD